MDNKIEKDINKLLPQELGKLFPIILTDYSSEWTELYETEKAEIINAIGESIITIEHIGSTAIKGIKAKPTVDMLVEIKENTNIKDLKNKMFIIGYCVNYKPKNPPPHLTFVKGYTPQGIIEQTYHAHIRYKERHDEIIFRDYLRNNIQARKGYVELKLKLQKQYEFDRDGYTKAKTDFVKDILLKAKSTKQ